jgi:hypothetical protein
MKKAVYVLLIPVLLIGLLGLPETSKAQEDDYAVKYAQAGMPFLTIDVGGRTAAMGGTQMAMIGDASAMFTNPAGLAMIEGVEAMTSVTNWIADIKHYGGGVALEAGNLGTFGAHMVFMDYGEFRRTSPYQGLDPEQRAIGYIDEGTFTVTEYAVGLSYARQVATQFYVGGNLKYAKQDLGNVLIVDPLRQTETMSDNSVNNIVLDFGTLYYPGFRDLRFGVSIRNFSNQSDYFDQRFELPLTFDFGAAMNLFELDPDGLGQSDSKLTLAVDAIHPRDYSERVHTGLEYNFQDSFFLRGGYKFNYDEEGVTGGVGVDLGLDGFGVKADYAYSAFGIFSDVHRVTLNLSLQP